MCRPECLSNHELPDIAEGGHIVECAVYSGLSSAQDTSFSRLSLSNVRRIPPGFDVEICNIYGLTIFVVVSFVKSRRALHAYKRYIKWNIR